MEEILHQLVVYPIIYKVFIYPTWCRISAINSIIKVTSGISVMWGLPQQNPEILIGSWRDPSIGLWNTPHRSG